MRTRSQFFFRGYRIAWYDLTGKNMNFMFDTDDPAGLANCNMPSWSHADLLLFTKWIGDCIEAHKNWKPLPEDVELS